MQFGIAAMYNASFLLTEWSVDEPFADDTFCLNPVLQIKQGNTRMLNTILARCCGCQCFTVAK